MQAQAPKKPAPLPPSKRAPSAPPGGARQRRSQSLSAVPGSSRPALTALELERQKLEAQSIIRAQQERLAALEAAAEQERLAAPVPQAVAADPNGNGNVDDDDDDTAEMGTAELDAVDSQPPAAPLAPPPPPPPKAPAPSKPLPPVPLEAFADGDDDDGGGDDWAKTTSLDLAPPRPVKGVAKESDAADGDDWAETTSMDLAPARPMKGPPSGRARKKEQDEDEDWAATTAMDVAPAPPLKGPPSSSARKNEADDWAETAVVHVEGPPPPPQLPQLPPLAQPVRLQPAAMPRPPERNLGASMTSLALSPRGAPAAVPAPLARPADTLAKREHAAVAEPARSPRALTDSGGKKEHAVEPLRSPRVLADSSSGLRRVQPEDEQGPAKSPRKSPRDDGPKKGVAADLTTMTLFNQFEAKEQQGDKQTVQLGVFLEGIAILVPETRALLQFFPMRNIKQWSAPKKDVFALDVPLWGGVLCYKVAKAAEVCTLLDKLCELQLKKRAEEQTPLVLKPTAPKEVAVVAESSFLRPLAGFMWLQAGPLGRMKEHHFRIDPADPQRKLQYGDKGNEQHSLSLVECKEVRAAGMEAEKFALELVIGSKVWRMAVSSEKKRTYWIDGLLPYLFSAH